MLNWFKKQTLAFYVACLLTVPLAVLLLYAWWWVLSPAGAAHLELGIMPALMGLLIATTILQGIIWLIWGIYRKKRVSLTISIFVFPVIWLIEAGTVSSLYGLGGIMTMLSLVIAMLIAWVYLKGSP